MIPTTLILDGIWGRPLRFARLRRELEKAGGTTEVFHYNFNGSACLEAEGRKLAAEIRRRGEPVNLLGFSMGGVVVRAAHASDPSLPIHRAAFINTPHRGSLMACLVPWKAMLGIQQLRPNSDLLRRLDAADWQIPTLAVWCPFDLAVFPGTSARWVRATQSIRCGVPLHSWPIFSRTIHRQVAAFFGADLTVSPSNGNQQKD